MATTTGIFPVCWEPNRSEGDWDKRQRLSCLMEKLRGRTTHHKSWTDSVKAIRIAIADKRHLSDALEKGHLQRCLESLQKAMKVISQQSLIERLEMIARHLGLSCSSPPGPEQHVFINSDMFFVEIIFDKGGGVKDVKIAHGGDANSCQELTEVLSRRDFSEFTSHLEGLMKIYQINGDKKVKSKAFLALQSLETDLNLLAQLQSAISGVGNYIHKCPLGILLPRKGGLPMKLIYFVSPYDLLDKKTKSAHPMTVEAITDHALGQSVTVCLEPSSANKLQTMPLMTVVTTDGKSLPYFQGLSHVNSHIFPACYVLVLPQPVPVAMSIVQKIQSLTNLEIAKGAESKPLLSLVIEQFSNGKLHNEKQLFVSLPDQQHVYFVNGINGGSLDQPGILVSRIPFTHPTHVPQILNHLRQQLLFNTVVSSCIRPYAKQDLFSSIVFELTTVSLQQICVTLEHPAYNAMVTVELDVSDITNLKCRISAGQTDQALCTDDFASRVFQRCLSIPITMRSIIKKGREQLQKLSDELLAAAKIALWQRNNRQQVETHPIFPPKGRPPPYINPPLPLNPQAVPQENSHSILPDIRGSVADLLSPPDKIANNPLLATLLDQEQTANQDSSDSPMLSKLLEDQTSLATSGTGTPLNVNAIANASKPPTLHKRVRKRRSQSDVFAGRSPKHRVSDSDGSDKLTTIDLESSCSPFDSSLQSSSSLPTPGSHALIDLTQESFGESNLRKLADSVDSIIQKETKQGNNPESELTALLSDGDPGTRSISKNTSPGSKNENASTSLEDLLAGSGEGKEAGDPAFALDNGSSKGSASSGLTETSPKWEISKSQHVMNVHNEMCGQEKERSDPLHSAMFDKASFDSVDSKHSLTSVKSTLKPSEPNLTASGGREITGIFEKFEKMENFSKGQHIKNEKLDPPTASVLKSEEGKVVKLKLSGLRKSTVSPDQFSLADSLSSKSKSSNVGTFDFKSDEDEDDPLPSLGNSERLSMTVYAASPTRLQITNKSKNFLDSSCLRKSEKYKRKELKYSSSGDSVKRKRGKDESKKERKKRKMGESNQYSGGNKTVYHSATVESDQKSITKLKIRVSKEPAFKVDRNSSSKSKKHSVSPVVDKLIVSRHDLKDPDIMSSHKTSSSQKSVHRSSSAQKCESPQQSQGNTVSKSDPKLATKTTIRLKPLNIINSGSSITVQTDKKPPSSKPSISYSEKSASVSVSSSSSNSTKTLSSSNSIKTQTSSGSLRNLSSSISSKPLSSSNSGKNSVSPSLSKPPISSSAKTNTPPSAKPPTSLNLAKSPSISNLSKSPSTSSPKTPSIPTFSSKNQNSSGSAKTPSSSSSSKSQSAATSVKTPTSSPARTPTNQKTSSPSVSSKSSLSGSPKTVSSSTKGSTSGSVKNSPTSSAKPQTSSNSSRNQTGSSSAKSQTSSGSSKTSSTPNLSKSQSSSNMSKAPAGSSSSKATVGSNSSAVGSNKNTTTSSSSSSASATPAGTALTIANYLPDAPTASSVASLPPIPKISSSSSSGGGANCGSGSGTNCGSGGGSGSGATANSAAVAGSSNDNSSDSGLGGGTSQVACAGDANGGGGKGKSPAARSRKGSLSAVIDKLTKSSTTSVHVSSMEELLSRQAQMKETETRNSKDVKSSKCENKSQEKNTHKTEDDKGRSDISIDRNQTKKAVSNNSSSRDSKGSSNINNSKVSRSEGMGKSQNVSPLNKVISSDSGSASSPRTNSSLSSRSVGRASPSGKGSPANKGSPVGRASPVGKPSPVAKGSPRTKPPGSVSGGGGCVVTENVSNRINSAVKDESKAKSKSDVSNSGTSTNVLVVKKGSTNLPNSKKTENINKGSIKGCSSSPSTGQNIQCVGVDKQSPVKRASSPLVSVNTKFNGESGPKEKAISKDEKEPFKVPTPKAPTPETKDTEDSDSVPRKRPRMASNKSNMSPHSDASSPENGLVIDCPGTPKQIVSNGPSPKSRRESPVQDSATPEDTAKQSLSRKSTASSSPAQKNHQSPHTSPAAKVHSNPSSVSNHSPCDIDDELMDEALMGLSS